MRKSAFIGIGSLALAAAAGCSGGGGGGDKADSEVIVGLISGPTTESGEQATFSIVLRSRPSRDVVVPVSSTNDLEGTVAPASLTFTRENWDAPQSVLVTGIDDAQKDGNAAYTISVGQPVTDDENYALLDPEDVLVTNLDDETAGVRLTPASGPVTELGTQATFTITLQSRPTSDVLVVFGTSDLSEGQTDTTEATFTPDNWDAPVTVTVTGVNDAEADGTRNFAILFASAFSEDPDYAFLPIDAVSVTNLDDDTAGIFVDRNSGVTSELLDEETFSVRLLSRPSAVVSLTWTLSNTAEASFSTTSSSTFTQQFTVNNWDTPQTFIVRGDNDSAADGDKPYTVSVTAVTSQDAAYVAASRPLINLVNIDNDIAGFIVSPPTGPTAEVAGFASFQVSLRAAATGTVSVNLGTTLPKEASVSPTTLNLTTTPQTVTVTGKLDFKRDGHKPFGVTFTPAVSSDAAYSGRQIANVGLTNIDNGPVKRVLVVDDAFGTHADEAADEAGYEVSLYGDFAAFDAAFDAGGQEIIVFELTTALLPAQTESRLISWVSSGGQLIFSHWDLASHPSLAAALEVVPTSFASNNRLAFPAAGAPKDLFAAPQSFPAPLIGDAIPGDFGNTLATTTTAGVLSILFDDAVTGPGAVAHTRNGAVFVNGFSADDLTFVDAEPGAMPGDGIPDIRELYMNELASLVAGGGGTFRFDNNTPLATVSSTVNGGLVTSTLSVTGAPSSISAARVSMFFQTTDDYNDFESITLVSPSGERIDLSLQNPDASPSSGNSNYGLSCADSDRTLFDDTASVSIDLPTLPPFVGPHRPTEALSGLNGLDGNGTWKIEIVNAYASDSGTLQCWSLFLQ